LEVNRQRGRDAATFIRERPLDYLSTVVQVGLPQYFEPTTQWHPADHDPRSAHWTHHQVFPQAEDWVNAFLHRPIAALAPFGWYTLLPLVLAWAVREAARGIAGTSGGERARKVLLLYLAGQVVFAVMVSCMFALGENARYRFLIEGFIWILGAACFARGLGVIRGKLAARASG
jgi:hypothetical protein